MLSKPVILSIGGLDPSGGAGILADIKTLEHLDGVGQGVCTSITFQNHWQFKGLKWQLLEDIEKQINPLSNKYSIQGIKIGLVENLSIGIKIVSHLKDIYPDAVVVWDPIVKSSSGYTFHQSMDWEELNEFCFLLDVITPNLSEAQFFRPNEYPKETVKQLSTHCDVIVTSYEKDSRYVTDCIVQNNFPVHFTHPIIENGDKHGSGCIFSTSLTYYLAMDLDIYSAYKKAKDFTGNYLNSSDTLMGEFDQIQKEKRLFMAQNQGEN